MSKITVKIAPSDLAANPLWKEADLGLLVPPSPHALSFALPQWSHVVAYVEGDARILDRVHQSRTLPYMHPMLQKLFKKANSSFSQMGEESFVFPCLLEAEHCRDFVESVVNTNNMARYDAHIHDLAFQGVHVLTLPAGARFFAWLYYAQIAEQVTPRMAAALLHKHKIPDSVEECKKSKTALCEHLATLTKSDPGDIFLHTTFGAAISSVLRVAQARTPGLRCAFIGFPFLGAYNAFSLYEAGANFHSWLGDEEIDNMEKNTQNNTLSCIICEAPCIPLMNTPNLRNLSDIARRLDIPLVVDDSSVTFSNVDMRNVADITLSSLGGYFSGKGDSIAAAIRLNPISPMYSQLKTLMENEYTDPLWCEDASALVESSANFNGRVELANENAEIIADFLHHHPKIGRVYYPKYESMETYSQIKKADGKYGPVIYFTLRREQEDTQNFYNKIKITKCLASGLPFSILSPYTLLKFPGQLEWAELHGLSRHLLRLSVGLESTDDLKNRFQAAFAAV